MSRIPSLGSERGAVLVQTALVVVVLVGFGTFVVDYGVLWVGRQQAQNAADAGAMAGAVARAYDDFDDTFDAGGAAAVHASQVAGTNLVWGAPATAVVPSFDCPAEVTGAGRCVRVDVYRNGEQGSTPLPTWFAPALGLPATQGVKATATARVMVANATNCLRPWAIPDKWTGSSYPAGTAFTPASDTYTPPSPSGPGSGLQFPISNAARADLGLLVQPLRFDDLRVATNPIYPGSVVPLDLDGGYFSSGVSCNGQTVRVGEQITISSTPPVAAATDLDVLPAGLVSPRLVAVALFDVATFESRRQIPDWTACPGGTPCVSIVNIVGFVIGAGGTSGVIASYPGVLPTDPLEPPSLSAASSFLKAVTLVR